MNKLSRYIIISAIIVIASLTAWYFSSVVIYILVAAVVSLIGKPLMNRLTKIKIKKIQFPRWLASICTITILLSIFFGLFLFFTPLVSTIIKQISTLDLESISDSITIPLADFNYFLSNNFPALGENFKIEVFLLNHVKNLVDISVFSGIFSSVTNFIINFSVGLFSIVFISFFFLMEENMFTNIILALFPDTYKDRILHASKSISNLLTRYFLGISIESLGITILNTIGLVLIAKVNFSMAVVIALISGIFNVVPYIGPLCGDVVAVLMGLFIHSSSATSLSLGMFLVVILIIFIVTQLIDNYIFQPLIYSSSVKAHPLEIFIVFLLAGHKIGRAHV